MFQSAVDKAKEADKVQGVAVINEFLAYKKKVCAIRCSASSGVHGKWE